MDHAILRTDAPVEELNVVPLIDVLLVLLVMFIITIPMQTDAVKIDLPVGPPVHDLVKPTRKEIVVTSGDEIQWDGAAVTRARLSVLLATSQQLEPEPELHLKPQPDARYELVNEVLAMSKRAQVGRMGFVGNEAYSTF